MTTSWRTAPNASTYLPSLNAAELIFGIPPDLLARIAYQESSWRPEVVSGKVASRAGCLGLMQLNPKYYPNAGKDWHVDIDTAGELLRQLFTRFQDWQVAVGAYNYGQGNMDAYLKGILMPLPSETENYIAAVIGDVPLPGAIFDITPLTGTANV